MADRFANLRNAFPDYPVDSLPSIPPAWPDVSWRNDVCPSFQVAEHGPEGARRFVHLFVDYADEGAREMPGGKRFSVLSDMPDGTVKDAGTFDDFDEAGRAAYRALLEALGFEEIHTGGGCMAWLRTLPNGWDVVATGDDGMAAPEPSGWLIGTYPDRDWQPDDEGALTVYGGATSEIGFSEMLQQAIADAEAQPRRAPDPDEALLERMREGRLSVDDARQLMRKEAEAPRPCADTLAELARVIAAGGEQG